MNTAYSSASTFPIGDFVSAFARYFLHSTKKVERAKLNEGIALGIELSINGDVGDVRSDMGSGVRVGFKLGN